MTTDERDELQRDAHSLAYTAIRFSNLYKSLTNEQWEAKACVYGGLVVGLLEELIAEDETELERQRQEKQANDHRDG